MCGSHRSGSLTKERKLQKIHDQMKADYLWRKSLREAGIPLDQPFIEDFIKKPEHKDSKNNGEEKGNGH